MAFDGANYELMPRDLRLALSGELQATLDQASKAIQKAADIAVTNITNSTKLRLREMVTGGLGKRLSNSVRGRVYENGSDASGAIARNPAGWIYVQESAVHIFRAFEDPGVTITPNSAGGLVIPIPGSPADRKNFGQLRAGQTILETLKARGVVIAYVPARGDNPPMLVAKSVRLTTSKAGRQKVSNAALTKSGGYANRAADIPLFWLVPRTKMPAKLNWNREFLRAVDGFMDLFAVEFERQLTAWAGSR